jgi:hypothetical protein
MGGAADSPWSVSNSQADDLLVWLEPWAEEFVIASRSTMALEIANGGSGDTDIDVEIEETDGRIILWARSGQIVRVFIDDILQRSASASVEFPAIPGFTTKGFLSLTMGDHPEARVGGAPFAPEKLPFWVKLQGWFGI